MTVKLKKSNPDKPKLNPTVASKLMLELEKRLELTKTMAWAMGDDILVVTSQHPLPESGLKEDVYLYSSVSNRHEGYWLITHQFEGRGINPEDPLFTEEAGIDILKRVGDLLNSEGFVKIPQGFKITEWACEKDFMLNKSDPDYEGIALTATIVGNMERGATLSAVMMLLRDLGEVPLVKVEALADKPKPC